MGTGGRVIEGEDGHLVMGYSRFGKGVGWEDAYGGLFDSI